MENTSLIITGIYTAVYLVVFIIQQRQINSHKNIIASMKSFIDIFKVDELKKYADLREESMNLKLNNTLSNDPKIVPNRLNSWTGFVA